MKKETFDKYVKFLHLLKTSAPIYVMKDYQRTYHVGDAFVNFLIKSGVIKRLVGGSFEFSNSHLKAEHIVNDYRFSCESRNEPKQPKPEPDGFAYPISVRCSNMSERGDLKSIFKQLGYHITADTPSYENFVNNGCGKNGRVETCKGDGIYSEGRYHIDHFDANLIRDIASVRTGDVWVKGEPFYDSMRSKYYNTDGGGVTVCVGLKPSNMTYMRRPTIAEICDHHGYELNGMNIVKKSEPEPYPAPVKLTPLEEHEAEVIKLLKSIESDHGVSYSLTRTETRKIKLL